MNIVKPILAGSAIYLVLDLTNYLGEVAGDIVPLVRAMSILGTGTLLGFFLPGIVAGSLTQSRPLLVGCVLGVVVSSIYFALSVFFLGWEWAVAGIRLSPVAIPFLFVTALACTYGGHLANRKLKEGRSHAVT